MKTGVLTLYRDNLAVQIGYDLLLGLPEPQIKLVPPWWCELTEDERDELELEVLQREGQSDDD